MQPISDSDAIFARAYASAIKKKFEIDVGEHNCILTSPVTQRGMAAGDLIYPQMTNYLIYKFADALQSSDNPSYTGGSAGSYIHQLRSYIDWIKTTANPSQAVVDRMNKARDAATAASRNHFTVLAQAQSQFTQIKELYPNVQFWQWVAAGNYPPLDASERMRAVTQTELYQAMQAYYGPEATTISAYMTSIVNAHGANSLPGYNQDGLLDDQDLISQCTDYANSGIKSPESGIIQSTICVPMYSLPTYSSYVQSWITTAREEASRDQVITIDINQGKNSKWEDYGFKEINGGSGAGLWPFFSAEVYSNNKWETRTLKTSGREDSISVQLAMIGSQNFNIQPGQWDVANIKTLFPNRLSDAPDALSSKYAKVVSVLVGYDVELKVEFGSELREEVDQIYQAVKSTGGSMSIFGFHVSAGNGGRSTDHVVTKFNDVKWDKASGSMSLTPTAGQVYPTILGAVAQRFD